MCVCVCERGREREFKPERKKEILEKKRNNRLAWFETMYLLLKRGKKHCLKID